MAAVSPPVPDQDGKERYYNAMQGINAPATTPEVAKQLPRDVLQRTEGSTLTEAHASAGYQEKERREATALHIRYNPKQESSTSAASHADSSCISEAVIGAIVLVQDCSTSHYVIECASTRMTLCRQCYKASIAFGMAHKP
ncbi:hypothetical protein MRX96_050270 [Rhipicephalus microplus]